MPSGRPKRWRTVSADDGVTEVALYSWKYFSDLITLRMLDFPQYVFRGQGDYKWLLLSSLDRHLRDSGIEPSEGKLLDHEERFRASVLGRRGVNPRTLDEDEMWALGQHYGLKSPLLDWTSSPFVAAFFACADENAGDADRAAVFALAEKSISRYCESLDSDSQAESPVPEDAKPLVEFKRPQLDESANLVSQGGLFTRTATGMDIETWVRSHFPGERRQYLIKITFPRDGCAPFLAALNRMNINYKSLFPDMYGSARYCNYALVNKNYC